MRSVTSYFNPTLFRKNFARFWPIWGLYGIVWVFLLPMNLLLNRQNLTQAQARLLPLDLLNSSGWTSAALLLALFFGILAAMAVFSYLYNSRSVGLMHALPMRREGLFLTSYLSGLAFFLLPNLLVFLLALIVEAALGTVVFSSLFTWLVVTSLLCLFFYSFAVFCAMFTGHILALPAFYFVLNFLAAGLSVLLSQMALELLLGFAGAAWLEQMARWLSPALILSSSCGIYYSETEQACFAGLGCVALYALVGAALALLALAAYRRRQLESAGDVVSVSWVRPVFKYGVAFCAAAALGGFFYNLLYNLLPRGAWSLLAVMLLCGALGYFLAEMLLHKSFWVFRRGWKGCVVFLCCLAGAMCALEFDVAGFEVRVPAQDQIQSVQISGIASSPYDSMSYISLELDTPEGIQAVLQLHQSIVDHRAALEAEAQLHSVYEWVDQGDGIDIQTKGYSGLSIVYALADGSVVRRDYSYDLPVTAETLADPASPAALLDALLNRADLGLAQAGYFQSWSEGDQLVSAVVTNLYDPAEEAYCDYTLPANALDAVLQAVWADLADGGLGRRYLLASQERMDNCYYNDLILTFLPVDENGRLTGADYAYTIAITLQAPAEHTLAALEDGGLDLERLCTQAEAARLQYRLEAGIDIPVG